MAEKLHREIQSISQLLDQNTMHKQASLAELEIQRVLIQQREALIRHLQQEQKKSYDSIFRDLFQISLLLDELEKMRNDYALMIRAVYRYGEREKQWWYILAAAHPIQAFNRYNFFRAALDGIRQQGNLIRHKQLLYEERARQLNEKLHTKEMLISRLKQELDQLRQEQESRRKYLAQLNMQQHQLVKAQQLQQQQLAQLQKEIDRVTRQGYSSPAQQAEEPSFTSEHLTERFREHSGRLPWPVSSGIITSYFGVHPHPELKKVKVRNNGINIATTPGTEVTAVFDGIVSHVLMVPGFHKVVIVRHGDFLTVYSNLKEVTVQPGQKITMRQPIGVLGEAQDGKYVELHFELWNEKTLLDPFPWFSASPGSFVRQ